MPVDLIMPLSLQRHIVEQLQKEVLSLQTFAKKRERRTTTPGLELIEQAFPQKEFPLAAVHEFISTVREDAAATNGFIAALLGKLTTREGMILWVSTQRSLFPTALKVFCMDPERIIFIDVDKQKEVLWVVEEALKCHALAAVVGELKELNFKESRRLQLAVEQSQVTGFIHCYNQKAANPVACVSRWQITQLPSTSIDGMPGVGFPRWHVQLLKIRNGRPGSWEMEWSAGGFHVTSVQTTPISIIHKRKTG